jgi:hypothetical protein
MSSVLFQHFLKDFEKKTAGKRTTYLIPIEKLRGLGACNWSRQRPADEARVLEIRRGIEASGDVSGILCMAWHPTEKLIVYDGQHRWKALLSIESSNIKVFVEILWDSTEDEIVAAFKTVNACVPVSELYLSAEATDVRPEINDIIVRICKNFPEFVSTAAKPNRPQFNRDVLAQELYEIWSDTFEKQQSIRAIEKGLMTLNRKYHEDPLSYPRTIVRKNPRIYEKCDKHRFWLFAESGHINRNHLVAMMSIPTDSNTKMLV